MKLAVSQTTLGDRVVIKGIGCDLGEWSWLKIHTIWQHWKIGIPLY
jgi:hypothetical protein